jgi:hypothetical protein
MGHEKLRLQHHVIVKLQIAVERTLFSPCMLWLFKYIHLVLVTILEARREALLEDLFVTSSMLDS